MGADRLKEKGSFTTELSATDVTELVYQVLDLMKEEIKKKIGFSAEIIHLLAEIDEMHGYVDTIIKVKVPILNPEFNARFGMFNELGQDRNPTGRLLTTKLQVKPAIYARKDIKGLVADYVEGDKINDSFKTALNSLMQKRGAKVQGVSMAFTPGNKLRVRVEGSRL